MTEKKKISWEEIALKKLARRSMSEYEMAGYLREKGAGAEEISMVTKNLRELGYLNDREFCRMWISYASGKNRSFRLILQELKQKGIGEELAREEIETFREENDLSEEDKARAEAEKVLRQAGYGRAAPVPEKILGRVGRRLYARGFSKGMIYSLLEEIRESAQEEECPESF